MSSLFLICYIGKLSILFFLYLFVLECILSARTLSTFLHTYALDFGVAFACSLFPKSEEVSFVSTTWDVDPDIFTLGRWAALRKMPKVL